MRSQWPSGGKKILRDRSLIAKLYGELKELESGHMGTLVVCLEAEQKSVRQGEHRAWPLVDHYRVMTKQKLGGEP